MKTSHIVFGAFALSASATAAWAQAPVGPDGLTWSSDPYPDAGLLPRLTGEGADRINARLDELDAQASAFRRECLADGDPAETDWSRTVWAPFTGPRFLSITVNESYHCGGAYPAVQLSYLVLDRRSGTAADWSTLWPAAGIRPFIDDVEIASGITSAPALVDWYRKAVRADPVNEAHWLDVCELPEDGVLERPVVIWLDAEQGGIGMDWAFLPHAIRACGSSQIMPIDEAERLGLSPDVAQAVRQGYADRAYRGS